MHVIGAGGQVGELVVAGRIRGGGCLDRAGSTQKLYCHAGNTGLTVVVEAVTIGIQPNRVADGGAGSAVRAARDKAGFHVVVGLTGGQCNRGGYAGRLVGAAVDGGVAQDTLAGEAIAGGGNEFDLVNTRRQVAEVVQSAAVRRRRGKHCGARAVQQLNRNARNAKARVEAAFKAGVAGVKEDNVADGGTRNRVEGLLDLADRHR